MRKPALFLLTVVLGSTIIGGAIGALSGCAHVDSIDDVRQQLTAIENYANGVELVLVNAENACAVKRVEACSILPKARLELARVRAHLGTAQSGVGALGDAVHRLSELAATAAPLVGGEQ